MSDRHHPMSDEFEVIPEPKMRWDENDGPESCHFCVTKGLDVTVRARWAVFLAEGAKNFGVYVCEPGVHETEVIASHLLWVNNPNNNDGELPDLYEIAAEDLADALAKGDAEGIFQKLSYQEQAAWLLHKIG